MCSKSGDYCCYWLLFTRNCATCWGFNVDKNTFHTMYNMIPFNYLKTGAMFLHAISTPVFSGFLAISPRTRVPRGIISSLAFTRWVVSINVCWKYGTHNGDAIQPWIPLSTWTITGGEFGFGLNPLLQLIQPHISVGSVSFSILATVTKKTTMELPNSWVQREYLRKSSVVLIKPKGKEAYILYEDSK